MHCDLTRKFVFQAAHHLPMTGPHHKCYRMHGHTYSVELSISTVVDPVMGWGSDFAVIDAAWDWVFHRVDHTCLNDMLENPTTENLCIWMWPPLKEKLPGLREIAISENPNSVVRYRGQ